MLAASVQLDCLSGATGRCRPAAAAQSSRRRDRPARQLIFARAASPSSPTTKERTVNWNASVSSASSLDAPAAESQKAKKTFASFDSMLAESDLPVLVDFMTQWCGPCQMMSDVVTSLSKRLDGAVNCVRIDCDRYPALASKYGVKALPTLVLFKDGKPIDKVEGYVGIQPLQDRVNYNLGRPMGPGRRYRPS